MADDRLIIWFFPDGKAGHERQVAALIDAFAKLRPVEHYAIPPLQPSRVVSVMVGLRNAHLDSLPHPDLILIAGRRSQLSGLAARRAYGGRLVVLMRPGLPAAWFDLCVAPRHDGMKPSSHVLTTMGALTRSIPATDSPRRVGCLILIGGPSRHCGWDEASLLSQIRAILAATPERTFTIADSRRTPEGTSRALQVLAGERITFVSHRTTTAGWIDRQYERCDTVWVTRDSVSMVFEAIASGATVGLLDVPTTRPSGRLARATEGVVADGLAVPFSAWQAGEPLHPPRVPLREADRCASEILHRWFPSALTESPLP